VFVAACSLRTTLCVRFKSHIVACGIIFMAARRKQVSAWHSYCLQPATACSLPLCALPCSF
jgi:hypothetical protein